MEVGVYLNIFILKFVLNRKKTTRVKMIRLETSLLLCAGRRHGLSVPDMPPSGSAGKCRHRLRSVSETLQASLGFTQSSPSCVQ